MLRLTFAHVLLLATSISAQRYDGQFWPCNPLINATGACTPNRGLPTSTYTIDFTKQTTLPDNWTISNYATVNFGSLGAEFTFNKRWDAPQLWTDFFILFGRVSVVAQVANGTGMISSAVLVSDDFDEIDFEMSGNNFGHSEWSAGKGQNNYFGKGITGSYDRGSYFDVSKPQKSFHEYTFDWTPTELKWLVDGTVVRSHLASDSDANTHQYPQTPSKFQLGIWAGGDPSSNQGTRDWAGGYTDLEGGPYTMYVRSVTIENAMPAWAYNYTDRSGSWRSIALLQEPVAVSASVGPTSSLLSFTSKSIASGVVSTPNSSTVPKSSSIKPSATSTMTTATSSSKSVAVSVSRSSSSTSTVPLSSTVKPSTTVPSSGTSKIISTAKPSSTQQPSSTPTAPAKSPTSPAPASISPSTATLKQPTATAISIATSRTVPVERPSATTIGNVKFVYSYTTTTKCTTTPKPTAYKIRAVETSSTGWAWNGWSNQWHGNHKRPAKRHHTHTHTRGH